MYDDYLIPFKTRPAPVLQLIAQQLHDQIQIHVFNAMGNEVFTMRFEMHAMVNQFREALQQDPQYLEAELLVQGTTSLLKDGEARMIHIALLENPVLDDSEPAAKRRRAQ